MMYRSVHWLLMMQFVMGSIVQYVTLSHVLLGLKLCAAATEDG
jgi:hypothetical protein